jgi:predicted dithiol-disulfide oxidoreductase (DUF899 family)
LPSSGHISGHGIWHAFESSAEHGGRLKYWSSSGEKPLRGFQRPMLNVFHRSPDTIRHFWASELLYALTDGDKDPRHAGTIEPLWILFDLTPEGRPSWHDQLR